MLKLFVYNQISQQCQTSFFLMNFVRLFSQLNGYKASQVALVVKNLPANAENVRNTSLMPGSGRSPRGGNGNPIQYSCLENPTEEPGRLQFTGFKQSNTTG